MSDEQQENQPQIYKGSRVTLIARTEFLGAPEHLNWESDSDMASEALSEFAGRICYMSYNKSKRDNKEYLENIMQSKHGSVLEHPSWSFLIEGVSRSYTHEHVRHRAGWAYSQLSQRYVDESDCAFVIPPLFQDDPEAVDRLISNFIRLQQEYKWLVDRAGEKLKHIEKRTERRKAARQAARCILPNATETKIVVTGNARAFRHFIEMRAHPAADLEIRRTAITILKILQEEAPHIFNDFEIKEQEHDNSEIAIPKHSKI